MTQSAPDTRKLDHIDEEAESFTYRKRLFIGLISLTSFAVIAILVLLWVVPYYGMASMHPSVPWVFGAIILLLIGLVCWCFWGLVLNILLGKPVFFSNRIRGLTIKLFLPLMVIIGRVFGISKKSIRASFINVNNELVLSEAGRYEPDKVLLLLPHCLQNSRCDMRLTYDINNCKRCGLCTIKGLLEFTEIYGVHMAIATGGTIARRIVVQKRPRLIIAVACERDLSSGIQDTYPLPVYGVYNRRPHGPCLDTTVDLDRVRQALDRFLTPEALAKAQEREEQMKADKKNRKAKAKTRTAGTARDNLMRESSKSGTVPGEGSLGQAETRPRGEGDASVSARGEGEVGQD